MNRQASVPTADQAASEPVRIDKWLWAARFFKTRGLATEAIDAGHVRILRIGSNASGTEGPSGPSHAERVKPSTMVRPGMRLLIQRGDDLRTVDVVELSARRGSAEVASTLYRETADSVQARELRRLERAGAAQATMVFAGRPTKQDRRRLAEFFAREMRGNEAIE